MKRSLSGSVPDNNFLTITPLKCPYVLAGHASGCWPSALGAGVPYNREKNECNIFDIISQPAAMAHCLKYPVYRQLVPLREQGSPQLLDKTLALSGLHLGGF